MTKSISDGIDGIDNNMDYTNDEDIINDIDDIKITSGGDDYDDIGDEDEDVYYLKEDIND